MYMKCNRNVYIYICIELCVLRFVYVYADMHRLFKCLYIYICIHRHLIGYVSLVITSAKDKIDPGNRKLSK